MGNQLAPKRDRLDLAHAFLIRIGKVVSAVQAKKVVGLLTSSRVLKGRTLIFELRKPFDTLVSAANSENGWGARIRT